MRNILMATLVLSLTACGQGASEKDATHAIPEAPKATSAQDIITAFQKAGLKIQDVVVVTEASDDNHLLGRPGQYTSKVFFYDSRHPKPKDGSSEGENTIEFFASDDAAKTRHDYIESVTKGVPMLLQYQVLQGNVLARFDKVMLPSEVDGYKKALAAIETE